LREELAAESPSFNADGTDVMARLAARTQMGQVIREVLRLHPPVAFLQRQTLRDVEVEGVKLPQGALLTLVPLHVQRDIQWWDLPDTFRPQRFEKAQARHPYAWAPFGGGAHLCLGLHLADAQMRLVLGEVLRRAVLSLPAGAQPQWRHAPMTHPVPGIPLRLNPLT